jgi:hypothetical protein
LAEEEEELSLAEVDAAIRRLRGGPAGPAAADLTAIANRAIIELHNVARTEANRLRGEPNWGQWARLANAARACVLQVAAVRDTLKLMAKSAESDETEAGTPNE